MSDTRLRKTEKLKRQKVIQSLFTKGHTAFGYPVRIQWSLVERDGHYPARAAFSVSRRKFKRAVDRNLIKRRMREAYRLNKSLVYDLGIDSEKQFAVMFIYTEKTLLPFDTIQKGITKGLGKLAKQYRDQKG